MTTCGRGRSRNTRCSLAVCRPWLRARGGSPLVRSAAARQGALWLPWSPAPSSWACMAALGGESHRRARPQADGEAPRHSLGRGFSVAQARRGFRWRAGRRERGAGDRWPPGGAGVEAGKARFGQFVDTTSAKPGGSRRRLRESSRARARPGRRAGTGLVNRVWMGRPVSPSRSPGAQPEPRRPPSQARLTGSRGP